MFFSLRQSVLLIPNMLFMILISVPALAWESDDGGFWENSQDDFEYDRNNSFGETNTPSNQAKYSVDDLLRKLDEIEKNIQFEQIKISLLESQIAKTLNNVETKLPDYATDIDQLKRENETLQNHLDELALKYNQQIATMQAEKQSSNGIAVVDDKDKNDNAYYHDLINDQPTDNWSSEIPEKRILLPESNSISTKNGTMHTTEQEDAYSQSSHHLMVALGFIMPWLPSADAYVTHGLRTRHFYSVAPAFQLRIGIAAHITAYLSSNILAQLTLKVKILKLCFRELKALDSIIQTNRVILHPTLMGMLLFRFQTTSDYH